MLPELLITMGGFVVGTLVGISGVGGGALMTPLLVLSFGIAPQIAVGTDLIFAAVTKTAGLLVHGLCGSVDWQVFRRLSWGSLPAALLTLGYLKQYRSPVMEQELITHVIGVALIVTSAALLCRPFLHQFGGRRRADLPPAFKRLQGPCTVLAGAVVGMLVSLTSIGAGTLGATLMVFLYPARLKPAALVGTDIAHAIPLAFLAGAGHLAIGNVDFSLLGFLLIGSLPGIILGSLISTKAPERLIRVVLAIILALVGARMLFK